ncbi:unnamed protein product, partial [Mesorhabditis belari]|uniref:Uncharacterized protein n=1 Tax=Mesorhabditis belari TaxID=2138241 RepID=A0AAF3EG07_9BILA
MIINGKTMPEEIKLTDDEYKSVAELQHQLDDYLKADDKESIVEEMRTYVTMGFMAPILDHMTKLLLPYVPKIGALMTKLESSLHDKEPVSKVMALMQETNDVIKKESLQMGPDRIQHILCLPGPEKIEEDLPESRSELQNLPILNRITAMGLDRIQHIRCLPGPEKIEEDLPESQSELQDSSILNSYQLVVF